jgi:hypothetical protein
MDRIWSMAPGETSVALESGGGFDFGELGGWADDGDVEPLVVD